MNLPAGRIGLESMILMSRSLTKKLLEGLPPATVDFRCSGILQTQETECVIAGPNEMLERSADTMKG